MQIMQAKKDLYVLVGTDPYDPCEDEVIVLFDIQPGEHVQADAVFTINTGQPSHVLVLIAKNRRNDKIYNYLIRENRHPPQYFQNHLQLNADVTDQAKVTVAVNCFIDDQGKRVISVNNL